MTDISKDIVRKIKEDEVRPYSRHYFFLKRSAIWLLFGLSVLLGSIAAGIAIFQLRYAEWDLYRHLGHSLIEFALLVFPCLWLVILIGFMGFAYYYFRHTEQGYRYSMLLIISLSVVLSITSGEILNTIGLTEKLETVFHEKVFFYKGLEDHKRKIWMSPGQGLLSGMITKIISEEKIQIEDLQGNYWIINVSGSVWRGRLKPVENQKIKIIGRMAGKNIFVADEIRPWQGRGKQGGGRHSVCPEKGRR